MKYKFDPEWLKITRIRLGLTQQNIADEMFVTKQTICNVETGKINRKSVMAFYERILLDYLKENPLKDITY